MRKRATMPVLCWWKSWPAAGGWTGRHERKFNARMARAERSRPPGSVVPAADVHEFERRNGRGGGGFLPVRPGRGLLVAVDDADLPLGELRLRAGGSSGGHHGLESIEQHLGSREFARLRLGIGRQDGAREITDYVLSRFDRTRRRADGKSFGPGGEPGGMLAERRNTKSNEPV